MVRPKDKFWPDFVDTSPDDNQLSCKFCNKKFKGGVSRIRLHLSGLGGNIGPCKRVPSDIQEKAVEEIQGDTSVGEGNRDKALKASRMKRARYTSVGEADNGVNVAERGEMSHNPAIAMPSHNQVSYSSFNGGFRNINGGSVGYVNLEEVYNNDVNAAERGETSYAPTMNVSTRDIRLSVEAMFQVASSSFSNVLSTTNRDSAENVADVLVKLLMSTNNSLDFIKNSHFRTWLTNIGFQTCLQILDNSAIIEKSLSNFKNEVNEYMRLVKESWKTTGCTMMFYNLDEGKGDFSPSYGNKLVVGFYCPKGFIFVDVNLPIKLTSHLFSCKLHEALKSHVLDLSTDDVTQTLKHSPSRICRCQFQAYELTDDKRGSYSCSSTLEAVEDHLCLRHDLEKSWMVAYEESKWLQNLIKKTKTVYQYILSSDYLYGMLRRTLKQESAGWVAEGKFANCLSRLQSIIKLENELKEWLLNLGDRERFALENDMGIISIINNCEFWYDGNDLLQALTPLFKLPDLMDTIVPTAGYLRVAMVKAASVLKACYNRKEFQFSEIYDNFWDSVYGDYQPLLISDYLNPAYLLSEEEAWASDVYTAESLLKIFVGEEEKDRIEAECKVFRVKSSNPFANISISECKATHPVKLWSKYGGEFPLLKKCAIKLLSRPVTCLCKQVEKHMSQLRGSDNYLLRLNAKMMEEFTQLGDDIYQPIDVDSFILDQFTKR